ncbi:MAG: endonuclease MutS2 [Thermodesulfobacteriota bacterium]|nr:MAG: endonuclease MutS2 [Thermodesulfobacteriota bacterium]
MPFVLSTLKRNLTDKPVDTATLDALEFPEVLKALSGFTATPVGREIALEILPFKDTGSVEGAFRLYAEASSFMDESGRFPLYGANDLRTVLNRAFPAGSFLLAEEFLLIRENLRVAVELKKLLKPSFKKRFLLLSRELEALSSTVPLLRELERTFDDKGFIADDASARLYDIRKKTLKVKERARALLDNFLTDKKTKELLQEDIITIRDDRFVLCVVSGRQSEIPGIIHGRSGSGATFFIEPMGLVEINNGLALLKREEKAEEREILKALTSRVLEARLDLLRDLEVIAGVDLLQAKALFAQKLKAVVPVLKDDGEIKFIGARHPLLVMKELSGGGAVVAVDVTIPGDTRVVVISGANTGGKTVALKTIGLLTLMASSAIPVPAADGSEAVIFSAIFADVGDSQDIEASLSTFSAHVKRLSGFLSGVAPGSLVLIDEIGAGTDPAEGGALGLAAVETLRQRGAVVVVTTHLNIIKAEATVNPAYLNVSVDFDEDTLRPLYRLVYGMPGASFGLNIAESLGLPGELTDLARSFIREKEGAFMESVKMIEEEKVELAALKERLKETAQKRDEALKKLKEERAVFLKRASERIDTFVGEAQSEIREITERFKRQGRSGRGTRNEVFVAAERVKERLSPVKKERFVPAPGERVRISGSGAKGVVTRVDGEDERAELLVGSLKVWVDFKRLSRVDSGTPVNLYPEGVDIDADMEAASTINILGMRSEEAIRVVSRFIDNAVVSGLERVEIIHGMGTGALKNAVSVYLAENDVVKKFNIAGPSGGGAGVTVVELK